jgi:hypothetical protein
MPYIRKGKCVYRKDTGEKVGCSSSVEKAKQYLKALHANITEKVVYSQLQLLENLRNWFAPQVDEKGKKFRGWVNCKTGGPCGRKDTSKGSYPACRPTKAQCKGIKGKMYKKKSSKRVKWKK